MNTLPICPPRFSDRTAEPHLARQHLDKAIDKAKAEGHGFALLSVDLDHFKEANDLFGHVIGDELLCAISRRLERAAEGAFIARVGGDEFTVVLTAKELRRASFATARRLLAAVGDPFEVREQLIPIGLSVGGALFPQDAKDEDTLIANADAGSIAPRPTAVT
jgi:diguanylate cyclase (GGDEF)-like protein